MSYTITVSFNLGKEYEIMLHDSDIDGMDKEQARAWLLKEFQDMECVPSTPSGKILLLDMILNVALYAGEARFEDDGDWTRNFARAVAASLQRPSIKVDVSNFVVG
ncbi:MAG: hypothetical protein IPN66_04680 [Candidatus Competibacteraceae bacterium]|nr:hypothetical protein [Candidatus Competibacteraceae bacterium]MBK8896517.1 hypothetical protein [Candidatus Competibacteraceae bacterium]